MLDHRQQLWHVQLDRLIPLRSAPNRRLCDIIPTTPVPDHHIKGRGRAALLAIALNTNPIQFWAAE